MKLTCLGGQKAGFQSRVSKLSREGRNYYLLQLFSGPSPVAPELSRRPAAQGTARCPARHVLEAMEVPFALTGADWPAFVVDKAGAIIRSNSAASRVFGAAARKGALLGAIWAAENTAPLEKLLAGPPPGEGAPLKLRAESGAFIPFYAQICPAAQSKWVLLQLFRESAAAPAVAPPAAEPGRAEGDFLLQEADWPAFLLRKDGLVLRANRAAARAFGSDLKSRTPSWERSGPRKIRIRWRNFLVCPRRPCCRASSSGSRAACRPLSWFR